VPAAESVFISYSRQDRDFVDRLSEDLRAEGVTPWIDVEHILPGSNWEKALVAAVEEASALIYVISQRSVKSRFMAAEVQHAVTRGKPVFPVLVEHVSAGDLPPVVRDIQWADFRSSYEGGFKSLVAALGIEPGSRRPVPPRENVSKGYAFLSYAEEDADFVEDLKDFLRGKGYAYWDYQESPRDYHAQMFLELEGIIIEAEATLSVMSESWKHSRWAMKEYFFSEEVGTPVFLLRAKSMSPTLAVAGLTFIDFITDLAAGFTKLDRELARKGL
jgi:hypothetical protein